MSFDMVKEGAKRFAALFLTLAIILSCLPVYTVAQAEETLVEVTGEEAAAVSAGEEPELRILIEGQEAYAADLPMDSHVTLTADLNSDTISAYRWQIRDPEAKTWIDISGAELDSLQVGYAMVLAMMDGYGIAQIRCLVTDAETVWCSDAVQLQVLNPEEPEPTEAPAPVDFGEALPMPIMDLGVEMAPSEDISAENSGLFAPMGQLMLTPDGDGFVLEGVAAEQGISAIADDDVSGGELQTHTVTVEYTYYLTGVQAAAYYTATVKDNDDVHLVGHPDCPTIVGYTAYIMTVDGMEGSEPVTADTPNATVAYEDAEGNRIYGIKKTSMTIPLYGITEDVTYQVYYFPNKVAYTVTHYAQGRMNDDYVVYHVEVLEGYVGTMTQAQDLTEAEGQDRLEGFVSLIPFENQEIAADGTTQINTYYDRIYYLMTFKLDGGQGVQPVYARYEAPVLTGQPTKTGYTFLRWDEIEMDQYNEKGQPIRTSDGAGFQIRTENVEPLNTMPHYNTAYLAVWTAADTSYTVIYWQENADDDGYSYWSAKSLNAKSGESIRVANICDPVITGAISYTNRNRMYIPGTTDELDGKSFALVSKSFAQYVNNTASGNGLARGTFTDSVRAVEWTFEKQTDGTFKLKNGDSYMVMDSNGYVSLGAAGTDFTIAVVDSTYITIRTSSHGLNAFGGSGGSQYQGWTGNDNGSQFRLYYWGAFAEEAQYFTYNQEKTEAENGTSVAVKPDGSTTVNVYYNRKVYNLRFIYAREKDSVVEVVGGTTYPFSKNNSMDVDTLLGYVTEWGQVTNVPKYKSTVDPDLYPDKGTYEADGYQYHYIGFSARYGQNIAEAWPSDVFENTENVGSRYFDGPASFAGWNGEYWIKYCRDEYRSSGNDANYTIKGNYQQMDDVLMFDSSYPTDSDGVAYYDRGTGEEHLYYLAFWANGWGGKSWSVPKQFHYYLWTKSEDQTTAATITEYPHSHTDFLALVEKGENTTNHTRIQIDGVFYDLYDKIDTTDTDSKEVSKQTIPGVTGYNYSGPSMSGGYSAYTNNSEEANYRKTYYINTAFDTTQYDSSYSVNFLYSPRTYTITLQNHSYVRTLDPTPYGSMEGAEYITRTYTKETMEKDYYPSSFPVGAYKFAGWYKDANYTTGNEADLTKPMPNQNIILYAKWVPKTFNVRIFQTSQRNALANYKTSDGTVKPLSWLIEDGAGLPYGSALPNSVSRAGLDQDASVNGALDGGWIFVTYAYMKDGVEYPLDVGTFTVTEDVDIYAKWTATNPVRYTVKYAVADLTVNADGSIMDGTRELKFDAVGRLYYVDDNSAWEPRIDASQGKDGYLADPSQGRSTYGANRTFEAKTGLSLYVGCQSGYYPMTASHTLLMDPPDATWENGNIPSLEFTFYYLRMDTVPYTVRYLDELGNDLSPKKESTTGSAVVTENYVYQDRYTADAFQKTLVLSANPANNVITFYYTEADNVAPYTVVYYYQTFGSVWEDSITGEDGKTKYYREYTTISGTTEKDASLMVDNMTITGYEYTFDIVARRDGSDAVTSDEAQYRARHTLETGRSSVTLYDALGQSMTVTANADGTYTMTCQQNHDYHTLGEATLYTDTDFTIEVREIRVVDGNLVLTVYQETPSFTVENLGERGTLVEVYYDLKYYPYYVYHWDYESGDQLGLEMGKAQFQEEITMSAWSELELIQAGYPGYSVDEEDKEITITMTKSLTIQDNGATSKINTINFYYREKEMTYLYQPMLRTEDENGNYVLTKTDNTKNAVVTLMDETIRCISGEVDGSEAVWNEDAYTFLGWYLDEACTQPVAKDAAYYSYLTDSGNNQLLTAPAGADVTDYGSFVKLYPTEVNEIRYFDTSDNTEKTVEVSKGIYVGTYNETTHEYAQEQTFYALYEPKVGDLTIQRSEYGPDYHNEANSFVYTITQVKTAQGEAPENPVVMQVAIGPGQTQVTISNLPFGEYTVRQEEDWSWRYGDAPLTVEISQADTAPVALFNTPIANKNWLSGFAEHIVNVFQNP